MDFNPRTIEKSQTRTDKNNEEMDLFILTRPINRRDFATTASLEVTGMLHGVLSNQASAI